MAWRTTMFIEQRTGCERIIVKAEQLLGLERDQSFKDLAEWQVVKLNLNPPPRMPYKIPCFIDGDSSIFPVNINGKSWVGDLKDKIKEKNPNTLGGIDARRLTLYRVEVDKHKVIRSAPTNVDEFKELSAEQKLSGVWGKSPPKGKKYYILVKLPKGKSIHCGGVVLMADVVVQMQPRPRRLPPILLRRFHLLRSRTTI